MRKYILFLNTILVLIFFNYSIFKQESIIDDGQTVLFELAPYDPRSLMQGDYMDLRYTLETAIEDTLLDTSEQAKIIQAEAILELDNSDIAHFKSINTSEKKLSSNEILLSFSHTNTQVTLPLTSSYFFEEGSAKLYENAKYGIFKYKNNKFVLIGLANENMVFIEAE